MSAASIGVFLMAYGAVESVDDLAAYYTDIRNGRRPSPELLSDLTARYEAIGGSSPLRRIAVAQSRALQTELDQGEPGRFRVFVGMRHWHPYIADVVEKEVSAAGVDTLVGLALAPHYSKMSVGAYFDRLRQALSDLDNPPTLLEVDSYHDHPGFVSTIAGLVTQKLQSLVDSDGAAADPRVKVLFTAHSLPERILAAGDPYRDQLLDSARLIAAECGGLDWRFAFQSAAPTSVPWLGPDILEVLTDLAELDYRSVLVVPVGFVCDHLEILYDIDIEAAAAARELGLALHRTPMPNDHPGFVSTLASIVQKRVEAAT